MSDRSGTTPSSSKAAASARKLQGPTKEEMSGALKTLKKAVQAEDWELALISLITAKVGGVRILDRTWIIVLTGCVSLGITETAEEALEPVLSEIPVIAYNILMKAYIKNSATEKCFELHTKMLKAGIESSAFTCGILLDAHVANHDMVKAVALFREMESTKYISCGKPNLVHYTIILKGFIQAQRIHDAVTFFKEIPEPDVVTYSTLIKAHCDAGMVNVAVNLLKDMANAGVMPDDVLFNTLLANCSRSKNLALGHKLFKQMMELGVVPSATTMEHLLRLYYKTSRPDLAAELLEEVAKLRGRNALGAPPKAYLDLFRNCIQQGRFEEAWRMYEAMALQTCTENDRTVQHVLKLVDEGGDKDLIKKVKAHLKMAEPEALTDEKDTSR